MDSICLLLGWLFGVRDVDCQAAPLGLLVLDERHPDRGSFVAIVVPGRGHRRRTDKEDGDLVGTRMKMRENGEEEGNCPVVHEDSHEGALHKDFVGGRHMANSADIQAVEERRHLGVADDIPCYLDADAPLVAMSDYGYPAPSSNQWVN